MGVTEPSIWHSESSGLHNEAWHVKEVTGDGTERELSDEDFDRVLANMIEEGWDEEDAEEWLASFGVTAEIVQELVAEK